MAKYNKLEHAKHNEIVCDFLSQDSRFPDWVITTAFYSAIHFVDHKIFPIVDTTSEGGEVAIKDIDEYRKQRSITLDKHSTRAQLVRKDCSSIHPSFDWLMSASRTARYINYKFPKPEQTIILAKKHLSVISSCCRED